MVNTYRIARALAAMPPPRRHVRVLGQGHLRGVGVVIGEPVSGVVFSDDPGRAINLGAGRDSDVVNRKQAGNPMR